MEKEKNAGDHRQDSRSRPRPRSSHTYNQQHREEMRRNQSQSRSRSHRRSQNQDKAINRARHHSDHRSRSLKDQNKSHQHSAHHERDWRDGHDQRQSYASSVWLNKSLDSFKIQCKLTFLAQWQHKMYCKNDFLILTLFTQK